MRRLSIRKQSQSVTLFPFLAVLICTMGSLIVLLVLVVKQADVHAKERYDEQAARLAEERKQLEQEQETEDFREGMLRDVRPQVTERLAQRRAELGYLEQNVRDLRDEAQRVERQLARLEEVEKAKQLDLQSEHDKLEIIRKELAKAEQEFDKASRKVQEKPRSFAIVPYEGGSGTRRRPIYIECTEDGIIIQPEGIVIGPDDLKPPFIPGNPLDAALLATREHLNRIHGDRAGNPYPLLIVRSSGTEAYQYARTAMRSWDDEFGYELISDDLQLAFPPADPNLANLLRRTIEDARRRQVALAAAQPTRFRSGTGSGSGGGGGNYGLRASPNGGFVLESLDGTGTVAANPTQDPREFRQQIFGAAGGEGAGSEGTGSGRGRGSNRDSQNRRSQQSTGANELRDSRQDIRDSQQGQSTNAANGFAAAGSDSNQQPNGPSPGGNSAQPGFGRPNGQQAGDSTFRGDSRSAGGANSGLPPGQLPDSLAEGRGNDWALPEKTPDGIAIRRPIRMLCFADHLVIQTGRFSNQNSSIITFDGPTSFAVNDLTSKVWTHMEGWGIAGRNAYWKPEIKIEVAAGGERRFRELEALMQNSGFEIRRVAP